MLRSATWPVQAENWTLDLVRSTPYRRFMKSHSNLKDLPVGTAKGLKVRPLVRGIERDIS